MNWPLSLEEQRMAMMDELMKNGFKDDDKEDQLFLPIKNQKA